MSSQRLAGRQFTNSPTCKGLSFSDPAAPLDLAEITISGRYPEQGWARNVESHEIVRVLDGQGLLEQRHGETVQLMTGDVVHVPANTWFAWQGDMTIFMACSPAFDAKQYEVKGDSDE